MDLGVILILTKWDNRSLVESKLLELRSSIPSETTFSIITIDGDDIVDLSVCLNVGIQEAIKQSCKYIFWLHLDFTFDDKNWFPILRQILDTQPDILKICASNSRDPISSLRIGQEQTFLWRAEDFRKYPWLFFNPAFIRCGGVEDWLQSLLILANGFFVLITPDCHIFHKGAQTRKNYDTNQHQLHNHAVFSNLTGFGQLVDPHTPEFFGSFLSAEELKTRRRVIPDFLLELLTNERSIDLTYRKTILQSYILV